MAARAFTSRVPLLDGKTIPLVSFGTFKLQNGGQCEKMCREALRRGYRMIDTAAYYGNEEDVGKAVRESGIPREEIFVTTKLWYTDHGKENATSAFRASMTRCVQKGTSHGRHSERSRGYALRIVL